MDFHKAFAEMDEDGSGEISRSELEGYMRRHNYAETFVQKWLNLFDSDGDGSITYREYCDTLGLRPRKDVVDALDDIKTTSSRSQRKGRLDKKPSSDKSMVEQIELKAETAKTSQKSPDKKDRPLSEKKVHVSEGKKENSRISSTVSKYSRSEGFRKKALYRYVGKEESTTKTKPEESAATTKPKGRHPRAYETERAKAKKQLRPVKSFKQHKRRLRPSITPGTILILLAGPHKGKRVVFLKQLSSGLLLVTGPFKYNGVPLRRLHQKLVIATKTKLNISDVKVPERVDDNYFRRAKTEEKKNKQKRHDILFAETKEAYKISAERKEDQKVVDSQIVQSIKSMEDGSYVRGYLCTKFGLFHHDLPHKMVF
jgi:large subunit ribosomal protein L6e